jgi:excisionase family DNA binding protein
VSRSDRDDDDLEKLMPTDQVADLFSVTPETVRNWITRGLIKGVKVNGYWRIPRSEVVRFAKSKYGS